MPGIGQQHPVAFQFGVFELIPQTRELRKHGVKLKLQDQPLHILILLLEHPGEIITREEIQKRLWPENTYVDFDNAINSAVRKLRDALGDSADNPKFIETLSRRGYRFIAPVSQPATHNPPNRVSAVAVEQARPAAAKYHLSWAVPAAIVAAVLAGVGISLWVGRNDHSQAPAAPVPITSYPGFQLFPSFSPEGTRVAFSWGEPGRRPSNIYVKMIGPGGPVRLTSSSNGDFAPAWSPDGRWIAFLRRLDSLHAAVMLIPALGGQEREITHVDLGVDQDMFLLAWEWDVPPPFLAWSANSKWLVTLDRRRIIRISSESGEKRILTSPPPTIFGDGGLAVSPDGKTLAFTRTVTYLVSDIYTVPISKDLLPTGEPQRVTSDDKEITGLAWTSDGRTLVFPSRRGGRLELWRTPAKPSSKPVKLAVTGDDPIDPAISLQAHRLVYSHKFDYENIWRVPLGDKQAGQAANLIPSTREEGHPRYSPDGKRIAFEASFSGSEEIWVAKADGSNPVQLTFFGSWAGSPRWSPDGRKIAFDCNAAGNWDIYVIDSQGGKPVRLTASPAADARPSWSRDGKWIYFGSNRTGMGQIWKLPSSGGQEIQVTKHGGDVPFESEDGEALYYSRELEIWGMPLSGGNEFKLPISIYKDNFAVAKHGVYFIDGNDARLKLFDFEIHAVKSIAPVPGPIGDEMSISPDEQWMIYEKTNYPGSELMLVENFR